MSVDQLELPELQVLQVAEATMSIPIPTVKDPEVSTTGYMSCVHNFNRLKCVIVILASKIATVCT